MSDSRTLAVILAADAVGYSRLAEKDEKAALAAVAWFKERAAEIVDSHGGRIFAQAGDGIMAELPSAGAGVRAALELAETVRIRVANADRPALPIRIGAHLGDVTPPEGDNRMGHDVNIAARLEQIAEAGEVFVSRALAEAAKGKVSAHFERVGMERLKNLTEAVEVFRVSPAAPAMRPGKAILSVAAIAVVAVIASIGAGYVIARLTGDGEESGAAAVASTERPALADGASIAVLPFVNMSSDTEQDYFSDGLSEELLNQLAQIKDLRVISRTSSFAFKGQNADVRTIADALGVGHVLEGSVRKSGDTLRITAQLIDASDGSHVWSETYDRPFDDVFAVQDEISLAVAEQLQIALDVAGPALRSGGTDSVEAYDLYLRGRANARTGVRILEAIAELEQAIALDPEFAEPWAELVTAYGYAVLGAATPEDGRRAEAAAEDAALRAIELAPDIWQSQAALANVRLMQRRWVDADRAFDRARVLSEEAGLDMGQPYWSYLMQIGRFEDALAGIERTLELDPLAPNIVAARLNVLYLMRRRDEPAPEVAAPTFDLRVTVAVGRRDAAELRGLMDEAIAVSSQGGSNGPEEAVGFIVENMDNPEAVLAELRRRTAEPASLSRLLLARYAFVAASFGDDDLAMTLLRSAYFEARGSSSYWFIWLKPLDRVRGREEFKQLLRDIGLVDFWRETGKWGDFCRPVGEDDFECR